MPSKLLVTIGLLALSGAAVLEGQTAPNRLSPRSAMHITLPDDSPLAVVAADWGESVATPRGSAILLDLHTSLTLRNISRERVRGVTLLVMAQEVAPGGKASVSVPSLDVGPGEAFPIRLDLRLLRPQSNSEGPLVNISLDGVLFDSLTFYGPNKLNSQRSMTMWEMEARRDRKFLKQLYESAGAEGVRKHLTEVQSRLSERPKLDVRMARGRSTVQEPERNVRFAFLMIPGQPVRTVEGVAAVTNSEARAPQMDIENVSKRPVRYVELGWIVQNEQGDEIYAGSVPADVNLAPGQRIRIRPDASLKLSQRNGQAVPISDMTGFVNHVEFADGSMWIPERSSIEGTRLKQLLNPSPEEQRLSDLYRRKGIHAVMDELRKY